MKYRISADSAQFLLAAAALIVLVDGCAMEMKDQKAPPPAPCRPGSTVTQGDAHAAAASPRTGSTRTVTTRSSAITRGARSTPGRRQAAGKVRRADRSRRVVETAPIVVNGMMYLTTAYNTSTRSTPRPEGDWHYKNKWERSTLFCWRGRTTEAWRSPVGDSSWARSIQARRARREERRRLWEVQIADPEQGYSETMAPTVVEDKVLIGTNGGEYGIRAFVKAFSAADGKAAVDVLHDTGEGPRRRLAA